MGWVQGNERDRRKVGGWAQQHPEEREGEDVNREEVKGQGNVTQATVCMRD